MKQSVYQREGFLLLVDVLRTLQVHQGKFIASQGSVPEKEYIRMHTLEADILAKYTPIKRAAEMGEERGFIDIRKMQWGTKHIDIYGLTKRGYDIISSFNEWDHDSGMNVLSIYTLRREEDGPITLFRDIQNIKRAI